MKIAVVTGASRGLGAAIAEALFRNGFIVQAPSRSSMDIGNEQSIIRLAESYQKAFGRIDVLVNNAAVLSENMEESLRINATGAYHVTRHFWGMLSKADGRVVNVSSREGLMMGDTFGYRAYSVSKSALNAITRMQAKNNDGVLVNACCPGWFNSRLGGDRAGREPKDAAETPVWLASGNHNFNGMFFINLQPVPW